MLLVAPGVAQGMELGLQDGLAVLDRLGEVLQLRGEALEGLGVGDGLRHGTGSAGKEWLQ